MKVKLKDLHAGDEFMYVDDVRNYRKGKFLVLNSDGSYLVLSGVVGSRFLYSYEAKKVVSHYVELEVNVISKSEDAVKSQKQMGHFIGWKFGVPVRIVNTKGVQINHFTYLIDETNLYFIVMNKAGDTEVFSKSNRSYELIPHKYSTFSPRYPVLRNSLETVFCNSTGKMLSIGVTIIELKSFPAATLNIDGKTIELSAETTAELKKKLGI